MTRGTLFVLVLALASFAIGDPASSKPRRPTLGALCNASDPWGSLWDYSPGLADKCADKVAAEGSGRSRSRTEVRCENGVPACCTTSPNGVEVCVSEVQRTTAPGAPILTPTEPFDESLYY